jgi:gas vesicle protein
MGFVTGLVIGLAAGAGGAVYYSMQTGRDLRDEFRQIRSELGQRDFEALGNHLEDRFKELQTSLETSLSQLSKSAGKAVEDVADSAESVAEDAAEAAESTEE